MAVLTTRGVDVVPLLKRCSLPTDFEQHSAVGIASAPLHQFIILAGQVSKPGEVSVAAGLYHAAHEPNPFGAAIPGSTTLVDAIRHHNVLVTQFSPWNEFTFKDDPSLARWSKVGKSPNAEAETFCVATMIGHIRSVLGKRWMPQGVEVSTAPLRMLDSLGLPSDRITTAKTESTLIIRTSDLPKRINEMPRNEHHGPFTSKPDFLESLRVALSAYVKSGQITVALAATLAGTSPRTLQRRLKQSAITFSELVDQVRYKMACDLFLQHPNIAIITVGIELGYQDAGSFSRAFHRLAGMSPSAYRQSLVNIEPGKARPTRASSLLGQAAPLAEAH